MFFLPVKIINGRDVVTNNPKIFAEMGSRPFIVTGKNSGNKSGALADVIETLCGAEFEVFDGIENNPGFENIKNCSKKAIEFEPDYIIAIGGGSPLDASKAVAVLTANPEMGVMDLYKSKYKEIPLPIIAIPTTAGTGSEVTPYSILTRDDLRTKKSFASPYIFPKVAFLDGKYTMSLPKEVTWDTAADALSHAVEGYISDKSDTYTDVFAEKVFEIIGECADSLVNWHITQEVRDKLINASAMAGIVIAHTSTSIVHALGYPLTYFKNIPHGRANGVFLTEYLKFNGEIVPQKIDKLLNLMDFRDINDFGSFLDGLLSENIELNNCEIKEYVEIVLRNTNIMRSPRKPDAGDIMNFFATLLENRNKMK